ncbi:MAG: hypothetical protein R2809_06350 [Flavobacteriales bacterium]
MKLKLFFVAILGIYHLVSFSQNLGAQVTWPMYWPSDYMDKSIRPVTDDLGNAYSVFRVNSETDIDPGEGEVLITPSNTYCYCLVKINSEGSYVWSLYWPSNTFNIGDLTITSDQKILITGSVTATVDLDPSENEQWYTSVGSADLFVLSFDLDGGLIGSLMLPANVSFLNTTIDSDKNNNFYLTLGSSSPVVFDEQIGPLTGSPDNSSVRYMAKYSSDMELIWVNVMDVVDGLLKFYGFESDSSGNTYWSGSLIGQVMFNYSSGEINFSRPIGIMDANGYPDTLGFLVKIDEDGNVLWFDELGVEIYNYAIIRSVVLLDESSLIISASGVYTMELYDGIIVHPSQGNNITRVATETGDYVQDYPNYSYVSDIAVSNGKIWKCTNGSETNGLDIYDSSLVLSSSGG